MRALYKIVHTSSRICWEDPEKRIYDESVWMESQGHQVVIIAPKDSPLFLKARDHGISVYPMSFKGLGRINEYRELIQILENEQPYVVNSHGRADAKMALKAAQKTGVACRIISRHSGGKLRNTWQNRNLFKKMSHYVFTSSRHTTEIVKQTFKLKEMEVFSIPGSIVPPAELIPRPEARKSMAAGLGLAPDARFIGIIGPSDHSGISAVIKAFKKIRTDIPHHLVITGNEDCRPGFENCANEAECTGRLHFIPSMDDPWTYYRALDCGIMTADRVNGSPLGAVPRALEEAMFGSCPVIAGYAGGTEDIVIPDKTGLLYKTEAQLPDMVLNTLAKEAATRERVHHARELVKKHHTIDTMGRDIIRIYRLHQVKLEKQFLPGSLRQT